MKYRRKWFIFFVMEIKYIEKFMERFNYGEWRKIFRNISHAVLIGLTTSGRAAWQEEVEARKDTGIVLIHQEQSCTSELFKVIQDAILLILRYRTMWLVRATSSSTFITSDVHSICILIISSGLIPGGQSLSKRQTVYFLPVDLVDKEHKDPDTINLSVTASCTLLAQSMEETSKYGVLGRHQSWYWERIEVLSDTIERHHSSRITPSVLYPESC